MHAGGVIVEYVIRLANQVLTPLVPANVVELKIQFYTLWFQRSYLES